MFETSNKLIYDRIKTTVRMQESPSDVQSIMKNAMAGSSSVKTVLDSMYNALRKRYDLRDWFVVVYQYGTNSAMKNDNQHYFDKNFIWVKNHNGKDAAVMSFPTDLNRQKNELDSNKRNAIRNSGVCNKGNQNVGANALVNAMHDKVNGINVGSILSHYYDSCGWGTVSRTNIEYKFGQLIGGEFLQCTNIQEDSGVNINFPSFKCWPGFGIYNLPLTRKFTVPENEKLY